MCGQVEACLPSVYRSFIQLELSSLLSAKLLEIHRMLMDLQSLHFKVLFAFCFKMIFSLHFKVLHVFDRKCINTPSKFKTKC